MRKIIALLFLSSGLYAQPSIQWQNCLGGTNADEATDIISTPDLGYMVAGYTSSYNGNVMNNHGGGDAWISKLYGNGIQQWQLCVGGSGEDWARSVHSTLDGGYVVAGWTNSTDNDITTNNGGYEALVYKVSAHDSLEWIQTHGGSGDDYAESVLALADGTYIVAGGTASVDFDLNNNHGGLDAWIMRLTPYGQIIWSKNIGGAGDDYIYSVAQTADGGFMVAGFSSSAIGQITGNHGLTDAWVARLDNMGNVLWQKSVGGGNYDYAYKLAITADHGCIVAGRTSSADGDINTVAHGGYDAWLFKLDSAGALQWQRTYGGSADDQFNGLDITSGGDYMAAGRTLSTDGDITNNHGANDAWIVKTNSTSLPLWQSTLGGSVADRAQAIRVTNDGGFIMAGYTLSTNGDVLGSRGGGDAWVVKSGAYNSISTPSEGHLLVVYPNPTTGIVHLSVDANDPVQEIQVIDMMGRTLQTISLGMSDAMDLSGMPAGVYYLSGVSRNGVAVQQKLIKTDQGW